MTTRSRRRADANFEEPQAPDIHPMKVTLDNGDLTTRSHDSDFVKFLDLKKSYHKEFFEKVRKHALEGKYSLNTLQSDEAMRRECAYNFMDLYGDEHWGSPTNRRKYLDEKSLKNQNELAIYPDREDE